MGVAGEKIESAEWWDEPPRETIPAPPPLGFPPASWDQFPNPLRMVPTGSPLGQGLAREGFALARRTAQLSVVQEHREKLVEGDYGTCSVVW